MGVSGKDLAQSTGEAIKAASKVAVTGTNSFMKWVSATLNDIDKRLQDEVNKREARDQSAKAPAESDGERNDERPANAIGSMPASQGTAGADSRDSRADESDESGHGSDPGKAGGQLRRNIDVDASALRAAQILQKVFEVPGAVQNLQDKLTRLPNEDLRRIDGALNLLASLQHDESIGCGPAFQPLFTLLEVRAAKLVSTELRTEMPRVESRDEWFHPKDMRRIDPRNDKFYFGLARSLESALTENYIESPLGLLKKCLDYTHTPQVGHRPSGVFQAVQRSFDTPQCKSLYLLMDEIVDFRNNRVAHSGTDRNVGIVDFPEAVQAMRCWLDGLVLLHEAAAALQD